MLDETGLKILKILQEKARIPNAEVARRVNMAPSAVLERVRKLEKEGYIDGYDLRLNPERFGRNLVAFVVITPERKANLKEVEDALTATREIQELHFISGEDAYLAKVRVGSNVELEDLIKNRIWEIQGVRLTRTLNVLSTIKETAAFPLDAVDITCGDVKP